MKLTKPVERFILHWGEMGSRWGVNRSVSQIHALLYLSPKPLSAEEISETLVMARSNVSTSIKELLAWELIKVEAILGDRREHFIAICDVQEMFNIVIEGRKKREIDPTLSLLRDLYIEINENEQADPQVQKRIKNMLDFLETMTHWYDDVKKIPNKKLMKLVGMGSKILKFLAR